VQVVSGQTSAGELGKNTTAKTEEYTFAVGFCSGYQYGEMSAGCKVVAYL
jgi:hypothetical protein